MATTQEMLRATMSLQQNAQANLPVIPNNGNPNGVNNVSAEAITPQQTPMAPVNQYPWMQRSPSVQAIHQMLQAPLQTTIPQQPLQAPVQPYAAPAMPQATTPAVHPVMPVASVQRPQTALSVQVAQQARPVMPMQAERAGTRILG